MYNGNEAVLGKSQKPVCYNGRVKKKLTPFDRAINTMPGFLTAGLDCHSHRTIGDLIFMAQTQLDFYEEGEDSDIRTPYQARAARRWIAKESEVLE